LRFVPARYLWGRLIQKAPAPIAMLERFADRKDFEEIAGFLNSFFPKSMVDIFQGIQRIEHLPP